ncbi:MAG: sodium:solute symporter family transporter [Phycisphaeraceae bacterium]
MLLLALAVAVGVGLWASRKNKSADAFLYADRSLPWWAILGSIVATETSAVTVLSVTGVGYGDVGMRFLQFGLGLLLGRSLVAAFFMPMFFAGKLGSAYEVLGKRFGAPVRRLAGAMFLVARNLGDALRLYLGALVLQVLLGLGLVECVLITGCVTIVYTCLGGIRSVVWNDCIQLLIYMAGGVATLFFIAHQIDGGWGGMIRHIEPGRLNPLDFGFTLSENNQFWASVVGGAVLGMGTHGTDQMMVQRYLSTNTRKQASLALTLSGLVIVIQFALFLFIGVCLSVFYDGRADAPEKADQVYQHFIVHHFPPNSGLAGLMLAAVLAATMSTLSSSFSASASSLLNDFVRPMRRKPMSERGLLRVSQLMAVGFGGVQMVIGVWAQWWGGPSVVFAVLGIAGFVFGILLGVFALAMLVPRAGSAAAMAGALLGLAVLTGVKFGLPVLGVQVASHWLALIGSATVLVVGGSLSFVLDRKEVSP